MKQFPGVASYINYENKHYRLCVCDVEESSLSQCKDAFAKYPLESDIERYHRLNNSRKLKILFHLRGEHSLKNHRLLGNFCFSPYLYTKNRQTRFWFWQLLPKREDLPFGKKSIFLFWKNHSISEDKI